MDLTFERTTLSEVRKNPKLLRTLYALTLRGASAMRDELNYVCDGYGDNHIIFLARQPDQHVIGWALAFPSSCHNNWAYFYVNRSFRRKGVGSALLNEVKKYLHSKKLKMKVDGWDEGSVSFFKRNKVDHCL